MNAKKSDRSFYIGVGIIAYLFIAFLGIHMSVVSVQVKDQNILDILQKAMDHLSSSPLDIFPITSGSFQYLGALTFIFVLVALSIYVNEERNRHFDSNKTNGSSKWNVDFKKYNEQYRYSIPIKKSEKDDTTTKKIDKNMILNQDVFLSMDTRQTLRNNNVIIFGGSGTGKSRFVVKPNILQENCSFVVTDPSGEILESTGKFLEQEGYKVKIFNLVQMEKSHCYNPFEYIRDEAGVMSLVNCLIQNTSDEKAGKGDPFWEKSETALLMALIYYLTMERPKKEQNFASVMKMLRAANIDEMDPNAKSSLDVIFDSLEKKDPNHIAVKQWKVFKTAGAKTAKSILITAAVRLSAFNIEAIENLTQKDELDLGKIGDEKTALFVIIPVADATFNFLVSLMYSQLFETLYFHAENECDGKRLSSHVRFILDEFANIGRIPQFPQKLATMRKYEISCTIILQSISQLKGMYQDDFSGIIGNCDTTIFLGGKDSETNKQVSDDLGDATIIVRNMSHTNGSKSSSSLSYNRSARKLMDPAEIQKMDNSECIVMVRGLQPFKGKKYDYPKHPNYKYTGDAKKENRYVITLDNSQEHDHEKLRSIDLQNAVQKSAAYVKAEEDETEKLVGTPQTVQDVEKVIGNDQAEIVGATPGTPQNIDGINNVESDDDGDIWDFG